MSHFKKHPTLKLMLSTIVVFLALVGVALTVIVSLDAHTKSQEAASHTEAVDQETVQSQAAAQKTEAESKKTQQQALLNKCLDIVSQTTTKALGEIPANSTPESIATYQQGVLQIQQNGIQDCRARYPVN